MLPIESGTVSKARPWRRFPGCSRGLKNEFFPGFLVIGSNGGGEYVAFDMRGSEPWPVVSLDMTNIDLTESVQLIAEDFDTFLSLVGIGRGLIGIVPNRRSSARSAPERSGAAIVSFRGAAAA